jgi:hypothetical protein
VLQGAQRRTVDAIPEERDEMVTLLARAAPESRERLMLFFTRYHNAFHPAAARVPITPGEGAHGARAAAGRNSLPAAASE